MEPRFKHAVELGHSLDLDNYEILQIKMDYHKLNFIESFYINSLSNVLHDKKNLFVFHLYTKICFCNLIPSILWVFNEMYIFLLCDRQLF